MVCSLLISTAVMRTCRNMRGFSLALDIAKVSCLLCSFCALLVAMSVPSKHCRAVDDCCASCSAAGHPLLACAQCHPLRPQDLQHPAGPQPNDSQDQRCRVRLVPCHNRELRQCMGCATTVSTPLVLPTRLARVMQRKEYRSSDEHAWTFVYAGAHQLGICCCMRGRCGNAVRLTQLNH